MRSLVDLLLTEQDLTPNYQIYCDMDGVLTDFEGRFMEMIEVGMRQQDQIDGGQVLRT